LDCALKVRNEGPERTSSASILIRGIQRFHLWLPSQRIFDARRGAESVMKLRKTAMWLFLFAGVLYFIGGVRDIVAPGFFNVSPQIPTKWDIAMKFGLAGIFLAMAVLYKIMQTKAPADKQ
jgi:hypothetical protein